MTGGSEKASREFVFEIATYNVHNWIGSDGERNERRCLEVVRETGVQVAGLQEAGAPIWSMGYGTDGLALDTGMNVTLGPTLQRGEAHFGNVLLSSYPILKVRLYDISMPGREPRGLLDADLDVHGFKVRAMVTHFGLRPRERRRQARMLLEILYLKRRDLTVIMGDFNEWSRLSGTLFILRKALGCQRAPKTYPARFPMFALDRLWVLPKSRLRDIRVHSTPFSRLASDHLPLKARISAG